MTTMLTRRLFAVDEYERMIAAGIFQEDDRLELVEGEILAMRPVGSRHVACVNRLADLLYRSMPPNCMLSTQNPIRLTPLSEPQPDLALLRTHPQFYAQSLPTPGDVLLLIEVAESSLSYDRDTKIPRYAHAGIPEVWLVDLMNNCVVRYAVPSQQGYRDIQLLHSGQELRSSVLPELALMLDDFLV